jgi:hypothetical protein
VFKIFFNLKMFKIIFQQETQMCFTVRFKLLDFKLRLYVSQTTNVFLRKLQDKGFRDHSQWLMDNYFSHNYKTLASAIPQNAA